MPAKSSGRLRRALADPTQLQPFAPDDPDALIVIVETPKGSRNKYSFDPKQEIFTLKRVLPAGMSFPYDFGFVPSTLAEDGDPLDVLVLMDEPAFPGVRLTCRMIGIIEGEQLEDRSAERNDRIVAIEAANHSFAKVRHVDDLGKAFKNELEAFFVNYHRLQGEKYRVIALKGPAAARRAIKQARRLAKQKHKSR